MRAVAVLCTIGLALAAMAQDDVEGTLYWERVDAEIVVTPEGNLDITGRGFVWTANVGGDRLDAFLVRVPIDRLLE